MSALDLRAVDWTLLALVGLPVVAAVCLGILVRGLVEGRLKLWGVWVLLLMASSALWAYVFLGTTP